MTTWRLSVAAVLCACGFALPGPASAADLAGEWTMTGAINGDFTFVQKTPWLPYFEAATVDYSVWLIGLTVGPQVVAIEFWVEGFNFTPAGIATARVENNTMTGLSVARIGVQTGPGRFTGTKTTSGGSVKRGTH